MILKNVVNYFCSCSNNIFPLFMLAILYVFIADIATIILVLWLLKTSLASHFIHILYNCCRLFHNTRPFSPTVVELFSYSVVCVERHVSGWVSGCGKVELEQLSRLFLYYAPYWWRIFRCFFFIFTIKQAVFCSLNIFFRHAVLSMQQSQKAGVINLTGQKKLSRGNSIKLLAPEKTLWSSGFLMLFCLKCGHA